MDTVLYLLMFVCLGLVLVWYVANEIAGADGDYGLLSVLKAEIDDAALKISRYRPKARVARPRGRAVPFREVYVEPTPAYREIEGPVRRYRNRDALALYRNREDAAKYVERESRYRPVTSG